MTSSQAGRRRAGGMVSTQATRMLRATPQRTPRTPRLEPTPMIALEMTWVVETGIPRWAVPSRIVAAVVSAAKPWTGSSFTTRWPIVCMIRQPPTAVPSEIAVAATTMTQTGTSKVGITRREERERDDAHRLLGVVGAVGEGHVAGRQDLQPPEHLAERLARAFRKIQVSATIRTKRDR